jgi:membrane-associated phospholipid phosphatase
MSASISEKRPGTSGRASARLRAARLARALVLILGAGIAAQASAEAGATPGARPFFSCDRDYEGFSDLARSEESLDLYHGLAFLGGAGGISLGGSPTRRWSGTNGFDTGIRDELRLGSTSARQDASLASDLSLVFSAALLPMASIGMKFSRDHDCVETWDMFTDAVESFGLTLFITEAVKLGAGRERPYTEECDAFPPRDAHCGSEDRHRSFFSGHASLAAAGAGLSCSYAFRREAWGTSRTAKVAPCALGVVAAFATGALRVAADQHWTSDVLVGFAVGAVVGSFDTWGPLDLLKFTTRNSKGHVSSKGMILPHARAGRFGAQLVMVF